MTGFYGKTYRYKDKVIGVLHTLNDGVFMTGRVKILPLFLKAEEAQKALDEFAQSRGLSEVGA